MAKQVEKKIDVICLGGLVADVLTKPVDSLPEPGTLQPVERTELHLGGCAANTAVGLSKLGVRTAIIGKVGDDNFGRFIVEKLNETTIDTSCLSISTDLPTASSVVIINSSGERSFLFCPGTYAGLTADDVNFSAIKNAKVLFVTDVLTLPKLDGEPTAKILKKAQQEGVYTALDTAWDASGAWMNTLAPCLPHLDVFLPSLEEAQLLSGKDDVEEIADEFLLRGVKLVVIKLGEEGCFIKTGKEKHLIPAFKVTAVDTTGAGDSFVAGFLTGLLQEWDLPKCGRFANAVGAHCVQAIGASQGIVGMDSVLEFMNRNE